MAELQSMRDPMMLDLAIITLIKRREAQTRRLSELRRATKHRLPTSDFKKRYRDAAAQAAEAERAAANLIMGALADAAAGFPPDWIVHSRVDVPETSPPAYRSARRIVGWSVEYPDAYRYNSHLFLPSAEELVSWRDRTQDEAMWRRLIGYASSLSNPRRFLQAWRSGDVERLRSRWPNAHPCIYEAAKKNR